MQITQHTARVRRVVHILSAVNNMNRAHNEIMIILSGYIKWSRRFMNNKTNNEDVNFYFLLYEKKKKTNDRCRITTVNRRDPACCCESNVYYVYSFDRREPL